MEAPRFNIEDHTPEQALQFIASFLPELQVNKITHIAIEKAVETINKTITNKNENNGKSTETTT